MLLLLTVFTIMNIALVVLQKRKDEPHGKFEIHPAIPILGGVVCIVLIIARVVTGEWTAPALAIVFAAFIAIISIIKKGG